MYIKRINLLLSDSGFTPVVDEPSSAKEYQWSSTISRLCIGGNINWREHWRLESCLPKWQRLGSNYRSRGCIPQNGGLTEVPEYRLQTGITETQPFPGNMDYRWTTVLCVEVVFFKGDNSWLSLSLVCSYGAVSTESATFLSLLPAYWGHSSSNSEKNSLSIVWLFCLWE